MSKPFLSIIAAVSSNMVIGNNNKLPWDIIEDRQYFKNLTTGSVLIMGRKTYNSLPKILNTRLHIVVSKTYTKYSDNSKTANVILTNTYENAYKIALKKCLQSDKFNREIFAIGGTSCYTHFIPLCQFIYLTKIYAEVIGDTYFPSYNKNHFKEVYKILPEKTVIQYPFLFEFVKYIRKEEVCDTTDPYKKN